MARFVVLLSLFAAVATFALAQTATTTSTSSISDPQAIALATKSLIAMTGGTTVNDVTLTGTAARIAGQDNDTGSAMLEIGAASGSRLNLGLGKGQRVEILNLEGNYPKGSWSGPDQVSHRAPLHNSWVHAWYFPAVSLATLLSDSQIIFSYVGQETRNNVAVQHIRAFRLVTGQSTAVTALIQKLSTVDLYLDSSSMLPVSAVFNGHPDNDAGTNIPIEIRYASYQSTSGIQFPTNVEKLVNGGPFLKLSFTNLVVNSNVSDSEFQVQ